MAASASTFMPRWRVFFALLVAGLCLRATTAFALLSPPTNLHATADCDKITVTGTPNPQAVAYVMRIWIDNQQTPQPDFTIPSLPYVDNAVPPGQKRLYQVASVDAQSQVGSFGTASPAFISRLVPAPVLTGTTPDGAQIVGRSYTFTVTQPSPNGGTPTYAWKKNGVTFGAPSQNTYFISALAYGDSGSFTCEVTNSCGTVTSNVLFLHVVDNPTSPSSVTATVACDVVTVTWPHVPGAWAYLIDRTPNFVPPPNEGPWPGKKIVNDHQFVDHPTPSGNYRYSVFTVVYDDVFGTSPRNSNTVAVVSPPVITQQPVGRTVETGTSVTLTTHAQSPGPFTYTWRQDGQTVQTGGNFNYSIPSAQPSNSGSYDCLVCNSCGACVTTNAVTVKVCTTPVITVATDDRHVYANEGSTATLTTTTTLAQSVKWYRDGSPLSEGGHFSGTTLGNLTINGVTAADEGYYELRASGECSVVIGPSIQLSVSPCYDPPVITQQPVASQAVPLGQQATISVQATCCVGPTYRWKRTLPGTWQWVDVPGGNQATLVLPAITAADLGTYFCVVSNKDRVELSNLSELQATVAPVLGKLGSASICGGWNVSWNSNVPISVTLQYWTGSCGNGAPATLGPGGYTTNGFFSLPIPAGQQYFVQLSGVTPQNETVVSSCMLATPKPPGPKLSVSFAVQPYYVTLPFGTAVPVVVSVFNYGCSAYDGEISLASLTVVDVPQGALTADGDPAVPGSLLPAQIGPGQWRSFDTFYIPVTPPNPGTVVSHDISGSVLSLPSGGGLSLVQFASQVTLTAYGPK